MARSLVVKAKPKVLKWLRTSSGWKIDEVGKKLGIDRQNVLNLESGKEHPTLRQLRTLAASYHRPLGAFLLSEPPEQMPFPKDYRFLPGRRNEFDKKTILAIRRSRSLQEIAMELSSNIGSETEPDIEGAATSDDPHEVALKYRERLGLTLEKQRKIRDAYKMFNQIRDALEDANILVFRFTMPLEDARGFALADRMPAAIVINSRDSILANLFTLMHEFGHVLLGSTAIDILAEPHSARDRTERWCNAFASSFLLPDAEAKNLFEQRRGSLTDTNTLDELSKKYKISKAALLFKMLGLGFISRQQLDGVLGRPAADGEKSRGAKYGRTADKKCILMVGNRFVSLVADNFDRDNITYMDALDYLSIKSKDFEAVLSSARYAG